MTSDTRWPFIDPLSLLDDIIILSVFYFCCRKSWGSLLLYGCLSAVCLRVCKLLCSYPRFESASPLIQQSMRSLCLLQKAPILSPNKGRTAESAFSTEGRKHPFWDAALVRRIDNRWTPAPSKARCETSSDRGRGQGRGRGQAGPGGRGSLSAPDISRHRVVCWHPWCKVTSLAAKGWAPTVDVAWSARHDSRSLRAFDCCSLGKLDCFLISGVRGD